MTTTYPRPSLNGRDQFGKTLIFLLEKHQVRQTDLAAMCQVHRSYISRLIKYDGPSPEWVDKIAAAINATDEEQAALHLSAARARGYRI